MASHDDIKEAILRVAGNPSAGPIAELADEFAAAIVALDSKVAVKGDGKRETRVIGATEIR
jgi:hypothetical protein